MASILKHPSHLMISSFIYFKVLLLTLLIAGVIETSRREWVVGCMLKSRGFDCFARKHLPAVTYM